MPIHWKDPPSEQRTKKKGEKKSVNARRFFLTYYIDKFHNCCLLLFLLLDCNCLRSLLQNLVKINAYKMLLLLFERTSLSLLILNLSLLEELFLLLFGFKLVVADFKVVKVILKQFTGFIIISTAVFTDPFMFLTIYKQIIKQELRKKKNMKEIRQLLLFCYEFTNKSDTSYLSFCSFATLS